MLVLGRQGSLPSVQILGFLTPQAQGNMVRLVPPQSVSCHHQRCSCHLLHPGGLTYWGLQADLRDLRLAGAGGWARCFDLLSWWQTGHSLGLGPGMLNWSEAPSLYPDDALPGSFFQGKHCRKKEELTALWFWPWPSPKERSAETDSSQGRLTGNILPWKSARVVAWLIRKQL